MCLKGKSDDQIVGGKVMALSEQPVSDVRNDEARLITAYCINPHISMPIVPAFRSREWMDKTEDGFAYRCLPLLMASQLGWFLLNSQKLRITWSGENNNDSLQVVATEGGSPIASSHFGNGIVTWDVPYLFRTPPGYNLLVRGPANWPKEGIYPLEGLVETDWVAATFSINWKMTRPDYEVTFEPGEPVAMIVPQRRGELEAFHPETLDIKRNSEIHRDYEQWETERNNFIDKLRNADPEAEREGWQKHYLRGVKISGEPAEHHQTKLHLREFKSRD